MRQVLGGRAVDVQAASASQMGLFETKTLAMAEYRAALAYLNGQWIDRFHDRKGLMYVVLDMDSTVSPSMAKREVLPGRGISTALAITPISCSTSPASGTLRPGTSRAA